MAQRSTTNGQTGVTMRYFVLDHLGSVAVVVKEDGTVLKDGSGVEIGRQFYDSWGRMRNADGTPGHDPVCNPPSPQSNGQFTRGFTGQEQMPAVCLDNYNARIYDPQLGRFLTADSVVPDAFDSQSYNRYTYVDNRPLQSYRRFRAQLPHRCAPVPRWPSQSSCSRLSSSECGEVSAVSSARRQLAISPRSGS